MVVLAAQRWGRSGPDPDGITWECICRIVPGGDVLCQWVAINWPEPDPATWVNYNSRKYLDLQGPDTRYGEIIHQWTYTGAPNQWWYTSISTTYHQVTSEYDRLCMGVSGGSTANGASVIQWGCNGNADQKWAYRYTGVMVGGWPVFNIVNLNSHRCLGISGGSLATGAPAIQWECNGNRDQMWF